MGGFFVEKKVLWKYGLPKELTAELKRKADRRKTCSTCSTCSTYSTCSSITINLLELLAMVMTTWVMLELVGDRVDEKGDPILARGDNTAAVSWNSRCGGAKDK